MKDTYTFNVFYSEFPEDGASYIHASFADGIKEMTKSYCEYVDQETQDDNDITIVKHSIDPKKGYAIVFYYNNCDSEDNINYVIFNVNKIFE